MDEIIKAFATGTGIKVSTKNILDFLKLVQEKTNIEWDANTKPLEFNPFSYDLLEEYCILTIFGREKWIAWSPFIENEKSDFIDFDDYLNSLQRITFDKSIMTFLKK